MDYLKRLLDMFFTLFNRKTTLDVTIVTPPDGTATPPVSPPTTPPVVVTPPVTPPVVIPPLIVTPPVVVLPPGVQPPVIAPGVLRINSTSENKFRRTGNRTFFLWLSGGMGPFGFNFMRDGKTVKTATAAAAEPIMIEHNLVPGDYAVQATDSAGKVSNIKGVSVQPADADLTIMSIQQFGAKLVILLDAGRGGLGPYNVNIFQANGEYLSTVGSSGANPIETVPGLIPGTYFVQVIEKIGYWSNMAKIVYTASGSSETATPITPIETSLPSLGGGADDFFSSDFTLPSIDDSGDDSGVRPRFAQRGRKSDLDPSFSGSPGDWRLSDKSDLPLRDGYSWVYYVGRDRIVTDRPLKDYPVQHNNPYEILKMKLRNGVDSFDKWDIKEGKNPGEAGFSPWKDRTAGDFFKNSDVGSCVSVIVL